MSAYLVVQLDVGDPSWVEEYVGAVPGIMLGFGGEKVAISNNIVRYESDERVPERAAIFSFPSLSAIDQFMTSAAYAPYAAARRSCTTTEIIAFEDEAQG
jgi:uncharacterized protein (DUF1330 family)